MRLPLLSCTSSAHRNTLKGQFPFIHLDHWHCHDQDKRLTPLLKICIFHPVANCFPEHHWSSSLCYFWHIHVYIVDKSSLVYNLEVYMPNNLGSLALPNYYFMYLCMMVGVIPYSFIVVLDSPPGKLSLISEGFELNFCKTLN